MLSHCVGCAEAGDMVAGGSCVVSRLMRVEAGGQGPPAGCVRNVL